NQAAVAGQNRTPSPKVICPGSGSEYSRSHLARLYGMRPGALGARPAPCRAVLFRRPPHGYLLPSGLSGAPCPVGQRFVLPVGRRGGGCPLPPGSALPAPNPP